MEREEKSPCKLRTDVGDAGGADEATVVRKVGLIVVLELLENTHLLQDVDGGRADRIAAVLVPGEGLLVQQGNLRVTASYRWYQPSEKFT